MSLRLRRLAIDRKRSTGLVLTVLGSIGLLIGILSWSLTGRGSYLLVIWAVPLVGGVVGLLGARRSRLAFERENGRDAGVQTPIR